jgi:fermentation-respiration switch protein FrsA (DUF1100 family)
MKISLIVAALLALGVYCAAVALLAWKQRWFIFVPDTKPPAIRATGVAHAREVTVHTDDGLDLLAWLVAPATEAHPMVLYLHGNAGSIADRAPRFAALSRLGWGVLMPEYRGYGGNPGYPTEAGLFTDARAAYATLHDRGIAASRILLWGESLGTGVAVQLASEVTVGAVLLESPYTSLVGIARKRFPFVPVDWLLRHRFEVLGRIGAVHAPVLVMTGGLDTIVPPAMGRAVFAAANQPKALWFAARAGHNDLAEAGSLDAVQAFVAEHCKPAR